jgi:hypothetical protein
VAYHALRIDAWGKPGNPRRCFRHAQEGARLETATLFPLTPAPLDLN